MTDPLLRLVLSPTEKRSLQIGTNRERITVLAPTFAPRRRRYRLKKGSPNRAIGAIASTFLTAQKTKYRRLQIGIVSCFHFPITSHFTAIGNTLKTTVEARNRVRIRR